jgi:hypothetical protein
MGLITDEAKIEDKIVVVFDICSSSVILEDLIRTDKIMKWRNLLIAIKEFLVNNEADYNFKVYNFLGDGWILLFAPDILGDKLFSFLSKLARHFKGLFKIRIEPVLETTPRMIGLIFGIDRGNLIKIRMIKRDEYIGRAINIASRFQGSLSNEGEENKVLISSRLYYELKNRINDYETISTSRKLKNIAGEIPVKCHRINLKMIVAKKISSNEANT